MPIRTDPLDLGLFLGGAFLLIWSAVSDIRDRRIPNEASLGLIALFALWAALSVGVDIKSHLIAGGATLALTVALFLFRILGAGDAKLMSALALFIGLERLELAGLVTAVAGGLLAVGSLAGSRERRQALLARTRLEGDRGVPYGAAIAVGGLISLFQMLLAKGA